MPENTISDMTNSVQSSAVSPDEASAVGALSVYPFRMQYFEEDFTGRMSWNVLGKRILRTASQHANERDFEAVHKDGKTYLWVLSRMVIEMDRLPVTGEEGTIATWIRSCYRYFTDRCFEIRDAQGRVYGKVLTIWALIDAETRQPADLATLLEGKLDRYVDSERPFDLSRSGKMRLTEPMLRVNRNVYYTDLDKNGHLNSIRYIDYALDTFPKVEFESHIPARIEIAYSHECYYGDTVNVVRQDLGEGRYQFSFLNKTVVVCQALVSFEK